MSFSSDLWNGFDILKNNFLKGLNKLKNIYEIMFSFASLENYYSTNLEMLYEQYKNIFNIDDFFSFPMKTFVSNIKVECEYHKLYYNNIFQNILFPLQKIIETKKKLITKIFCDNEKNNEKYKKMINNLISSQENYHNTCKELSICLSEINIHTLNMESQKKQINNKSLIGKRDKILEKLYRSQIDYLNILTESNIILNDYNVKTEIILSKLEQDFIEIDTCIKDSLLNYSNNKIQLFKDVLEILNQGKTSCYEKMDAKNNINNFIKKYSTKEYKFQKFEFIPFNLNNINNFLLFPTNTDRPKNQVNKEKVIDMVQQYFKDNKIIESNCEYIATTINSLKKYSVECSIKYETIVGGKTEENQNLIGEFFSENDGQKSKIMNSQNKNRQKRLIDNINYIGNYVDKLFIGEQNLENESIKVKNILKEKELKLYLEQIFDKLKNYKLTSNFILSEKSYNYLTNLFNFILESLIIDDITIKNIIEYSQTFYKIKENIKNPKYYILYNICKNNIFNNTEIWHKIINCSLGNEINNKDLLNKENNYNIKEQNILNVLAENLSLMKLFNLNEEVYQEIKNYYIEVYKISEENLNKEINYFNDEKEFNIHNNNENQLIKGENREVLIDNNNEINNDFIKDNKDHENIIKAN